MMGTKIPLPNDNYNFRSIEKISETRLKPDQDSVQVIYCIHEMNKLTPIKVILV